jgi:hypothetical protein
MIPETTPDGRTAFRIEHEPEFDQEQYDMLAALEEYEAGLNSLGLPMDETTSPLADPSNPAGTHWYEPYVLRDWALDAIEQREQEFKDNPSRARIFSVVRRAR